MRASSSADDFGYFVFYPYPGTQLFRVCRDAGYLPDDYLDRPANHRESILTLPDLTQDDIDDAYERFTQIRERLYAKRYGPEVSVPGSPHVRERARTG